MESPKIIVQHFKNPNIELNAKACVEFIRQQELTRDQIVGITTQETQIDHGENWIALFYRSQPIKEGSLPFDEIQFKKLDSMTKWDLQGKQLLKFLNEDAGSCQTVAVTHTPRNVMDLRHSMVWYSKSAPAKVSVKYLKNENGDWRALIQSASKFLNEYIAPHQLVHVDFFEDLHPNKTVDGDLLIYCTIVHTAGDDPQKIEDKKNENMPAKFYTHVVYDSDYSGESIETPYNEAVTHMNVKGWDQGHVVAGFNVSAAESASEDDQFYGAIKVVVFSWQRIYEEQMVDVLRPNSCMDNCTIF